MPSADSQVSTRAHPDLGHARGRRARRSARHRGRRRRRPRTCRRPSTSSASTRAYTAVSTWTSLTSVPSAAGCAIASLTPRSVPQSSSRMITSCDDVHQTPGQVTRVGGTQRRVGQTLAGTVRGDEVLQHRQALAEVGLDRTRDDLALRVGHQTTHTGDLPHLHHVSAGTRVDHDVDGVGLREVALHLLGDLAGRLGPDLHQLLTALLLGDHTAQVLLLDLLRVLLVRGRGSRPCSAA